MFYIRIDEQNPNNLNYYCRQCGNSEANLENNLCIIDTNMKETETSFDYIVNEFTKLDPTLPRINNILCPNDDCVTNTHEGSNKREIIYIRYNNVDMKYLYLCSTCDNIWKSNK
jgi:aspartate carbamoyltransferase regulatory subunit